MRVLLIEPDSATAAAVEMMLRSECLNVYTTDDPDEGVELGRLYDYDAIVLADVIGAHTVLQQLRQAKVKSAILRLSNHVGVSEIVAALGAGADDHLSKPFHRDELVARIHALVRRCKGHAVSVITTGNLSVNIDTKMVTVDGRPIHLTGKEYGILELLSLRKGMTLSKDMFLNHLYGGMDEPEAKIIDVFICKIRKKLREVNAHDIETVWGRGYVLRDVPNVTAPSLAPEVRDMLDSASEPGPDRVTRTSHVELLALRAAGRIKSTGISGPRRRNDAGHVKSPSLVPDAEPLRGRK